MSKNLFVTSTPLTAKTMLRPWGIRADNADVLEKLRQKKKKELVITKCYALQVNAMNLLMKRFTFHNSDRGGSRDFEKGGRELYVCHHGWPAKKNLGFRWSKKAEVTFETISFWQNISISIFKFFPFLSIKSYQFFKIY